ENEGSEDLVFRYFFIIFHIAIARPMVGFVRVVDIRRADTHFEIMPLSAKQVVQLYRNGQERLVLHREITNTGTGSQTIACFLKPKIIIGGNETGAAQLDVK